MKCDVIKDLLPLYHDKVASEESQTVIEAHLESCPSCRAFLEALQTDDFSMPVKSDQAEIGAFKKMKRKLRKKNLFTSLVSVLIVLALIYGVFFQPIAISYDTEQISIGVAYDGPIDIFFDGNYRGVNARAEGDALYIGYYGTLFTRIWGASEPLQFTIGDNIAIDYGRDSAAIPITEQINRIYYLDFRSIHLEEAVFEQATQDAVLIWSRDG